MYDIIIKNGQVIDGTGSPRYHADVAIKDGKIAKIRNRLNDEAAKIIDAKGLVVTPGFIDSHSHADGAALSCPDQKEKIEQGITTSVGGQCGSSPAPISPKTKPVQVGSYGLNTEIYGTMGNYINVVKDIPLGANLAGFVGHSAIRRAVMGSDNREPTAAELEQMKEYVADAVKNGALGVSFGLIYTPSCYAKTPELIELAKVAGQYGGMISAHIRNEGPQVIESVEEFITVAREADVRGVISHHKTTGKYNHGKVSHTLRMIDKANEEGLDIYCDVYPYIASHTGLSAYIVPGEYHSSKYGGLVNALRDPAIRAEIKEAKHANDGSDALEWILIVKCPAYPQYVGKRLDEIAKIHGKDAYETAFDLIADSNGVTNACFFSMCEEDVETVMAHPRAMICTDSSVAGGATMFHPRLRATFPRVLGHYVRERGVVKLEEMIRKITAMPASVYNLDGKGILREGFDADLCIFDPDRIVDRATFIEPTLKADGLNYVILGGEVAAEDAVYCGKRMGRYLVRK